MSATGNPGLARIDVSGCAQLAGGQNVARDATCEVVADGQVIAPAGEAAQEGEQPA